MPGKTVILGITGSIAAYKACDIIRGLRKKKYEVKCIMTQSAKYFITPLTLETLSGNKVAEDMFAPPETRDPEHISLADRADVLLIAPASADIISKIAGGICDDLLSCVVCAYDGPVLFAPAMNDKMFANPIIQDKIAYLKKKGYNFIDPIEGQLACNRQGLGHLANVEDVIQTTEKLVQK